MRKISCRSTRPSPSAAAAAASPRRSRTGAARRRGGRASPTARAARSASSRRCRGRRRRGPRRQSRSVRLTYGRTSTWPGTMRRPAQAVSLLDLPDALRAGRCTRSTRSTRACRPAARRSAAPARKRRRNARTRPRAGCRPREDENASEHVFAMMHEHVFAVKDRCCPPARPAWPAAIITIAASATASATIESATATPSCSTKKPASRSATTIEPDACGGRGACRDSRWLMPRFRALGARSGVSGPLPSRLIGLVAAQPGSSASRAQSVTDATSIGNGLIPRLRAASSLPETDAPVASTI